VLRLLPEPPGECVFRAPVGMKVIEVIERTAGVPTNLFVRMPCGYASVGFLR
jgi:hypothetical protein